MNCDARDLPSVFVGIRDYIRECYLTEYEAEPKYERLGQLLSDAFPGPKEDAKMAILKGIARNTLNKILLKIKKERISKII